MAKSTFKHLVDKVHWNTLLMQVQIGVLIPYSRPLRMGPITQVFGIKMELVLSSHQ